jgi:hypothetical protein
MTNVIEGSSRSSRLGAALTQGIEKGADFGTKLYLKNLEQQVTRQAKKGAKVRTALKNQLSLYDKENKYFQTNPDQMAKLEALTGEYFDKGIDADEAANLAFQEIRSGGKNKTRSTGTTGTNSSSPSGSSTEQGDGIWSGQGLEKTWEDTKKLFAKGGRAVVNAIDWPFQLAKEGPLGFGKKVSPRGYHGGEFDTLIDYYDKLTGGIGVPENAAERIASGAVLGAPGFIAAGAQEGLSALNAPRWVQEAGGILAFLFARKTKLPGAKSILKETEAVAKKTGKPPETVIKEAMKEVGVTEEQIIKGDENAIRSLKEKITEIPESASKVKTTPKTIFNKKAALKEREVFGSKLAESPLEAHYDIEARNAKKEAGKGPEVRARESEIRNRLAPEEKKLFEDLRTKQEQLKRIEKERMASTDPEAMARLKTHYEYQLRDIEKTSERLKDIQYEMKHGRVRPSEAEIDAQIKKSIDAYEEGIKNPTESTPKDMKRQLDLDQQYLDRAQKILDRGELPGEIRPDTFIKMKDKYLKAYKAAIKEAKDTVQTLKGERDAASLRKVREKQDLIDTLSGRVKRLEADIVNQSDKLKSLGALNKPSGAFYKNQLKSLKKDQALFKHDLFEHKMVKNPVEAKADAIFKERADSLKKGEEIVKEPSKENIKEASEKTGIPEKDITEHLEKGKNEALGFEKKIENGTVTPKTEKAFFKWTKRFPRFLRPTTAKGYARLLAIGWGVGMVQGLIAEATGHKLDAKYIRYLSYALGTGTFGTTAGGFHMVENFFIARQAEKLKSLKHDPMEWNNYLNKVRSSHGETRANRVRKESNDL